jgi:hypothetical protein
LRKEENNLRKHIRIENQLKLQIEKIIDKLEELETENLFLIEKLVRKFI